MEKARLAEEARLRAEAERKQREEEARQRAEDERRQREEQERQRREAASRASFAETAPPQAHTTLALSFCEVSLLDGESKMIEQNCFQKYRNLHSATLEKERERREKEEMRQKQAQERKMLFDELDRGFVASR